MIWYRCGILAGILGLYVASFLLPALTLCNGKYESELLGSQAFGNGLWALLCFGQPAVLANVLLWFGWVLVAARRWPAGVVLGGLAVLLAAQAVRLYDPRGLWNLPVGVAADMWPEDEWIRRFLPGFECWLGSMVLLTAEACRGWLAEVLVRRGRTMQPDSLSGTPATAA